MSVESKDSFVVPLFINRCQSFQLPLPFRIGLPLLELFGKLSQQFKINLALLKNRKLDLYSCFLHNVIDRYLVLMIMIICDDLTVAISIIRFDSNKFYQTEIQKKKYLISLKLQRPQDYFSPFLHMFMCLTNVSTIRRTKNVQ